MPAPPRPGEGRLVHRGSFLTWARHRVALPDGRRIELDIVHHPGAAASVPFEPDGRVLLVRQYRAATDGSLLEVPAGKLDEGETPAVCAARELEEETGRRAGRLEPLGAIWPTPGFSDERIHLFAAFELETVPARPAEDEAIELVPMALEEAVEEVFRGGIEDAKSAVALLRAARHLGRLG